MGYRVDYGPVRRNRKETGGNVLRIPLYTMLFLLVFILSVNLTWPEGREILRNFLLPGNSEQAFSELVTDLKSGESFTVAVTVFCRSILENAGLPE